MLKKICILLAVLSLGNLAALSVGDKALELKSKYYNGKVFKAGFYMVDTKNQNKLKVLVFARLLAGDFLNSDALIENIGSRKGVSLAFATPMEAEIEIFMKQKPGFKYPLLFDRNAHDKYMEKNIIYPYAFVINYENKIIWDGELMDLPSMLDKFEAGKYDIEKGRRINRYLRDMQNAMRSGSEYQLDRAAREILAIDPGNPGCLRLRLFAFENTNRIEEAWKFLDEFRRKNPQEKYLYMLQIDMGARYPVFSEQAAMVGREFLKHKLGTNDDRLMLAWMFLSQYNFNVDAVECGEELLASLNVANFDKVPAMKSLFYRAEALAFYKRGKIAEAADKQKLSCDILPSAENRRILEYYQKLLKK